MSFITGLALKRRPVTILAIILVMAMGVFSFINFQRELFPAIEFPSITIVTVYPGANPDAVTRDVTEPIEDAIAGTSGLTEIQSTSSESISIIFATFEFGEDMDERQRDLENAINGISFPDDADDPTVSRINSETFPSIQLSVTGNRDIPSLQRMADDIIIPRIDQVDGVFQVNLIGSVDEQVFVTVDTDRLEDLGLSLFQVSSAISQNNINFPAGSINQGGTTFPVRTTHELGSLEDIRNLVVGFEGGAAPGGAFGPRTGQRPILLSDVADIEVSTAESRTISRTNGKPSLALAVIKEPDANTVDMTDGVLAALEDLEQSGTLPPDIEILTLSNDGPAVEESLSSLMREGMLGFIFAVLVVFAFLINVRPSLMKGITMAIRPTIIIGLSIPLSIVSGILLMSFTDITLNFMSLAGLAIAIGRVVDDSIVVLENIYRHIQLGQDRVQAAYDATVEVGAAIIASTLTTVVVFIPLAFIQGLVGQFFSHFAIAVSLALIGSALVAIIAVPVLGAVFLRQGDFPGQDVPGGREVDHETWMQRLYTPALVWALRHRIAALGIAIGVTIASLGLMAFIPITFFPAGAPVYLTIDVELPTGTSIDRTFTEVLKVEEVLQDFEQRGMVETYQVTLGSAANAFGPGAASGGFDVAGFFVTMAEDVPVDIGDQLRAQIPNTEEVTFTVTEITDGPPADALEINITGPNFNEIAAVARELETELATVPEIINLSSNVSEARDEVIIDVDPVKAAEFDLTTVTIGQQINQAVVGQEISEIDLQDVNMDIILRGEREDVNDIEKLKSLVIQGPLGRVELGSIANIYIGNGPVSITRFDNERSASITGDISGENTQAVGALVQQKIDALALPPGVEVRSGGIFAQIGEGFQDVFTAMAVGIVLVYLVMVATLGSLRNPFIIILTLPLAIVGALVALAITGRTLSLSAMMGFLMLIGVVVTNAIVLLTFVEQLREQGYGVYDALMEAGRVRLRPILMTAFTTIIALFPLAASTGSDSGIIGAELATVVIGGLISSTFLTLIFVPVVYTLFNVSIPGAFSSLSNRIRGSGGGISARTPFAGHQPSGDD